MKTKYIYAALLLGVVVFNNLFSQSIKIPLRAANNGTAFDTVWFGVDLNAT